MGARRRDVRAVGARPSGVPELRRRHVGAAFRRRADPPGWQVLAQALVEDWNGQDTSIAEIERELARLRGSVTNDGPESNMRTSVMTHCAWVPPEWLERAEATLEGLAERHPSR